jgi:FtsP/CotA-like multicopper oxidase with cupredoxin domain
MAKSKVTRRQLLVAAAPAIAAVPLCKVALPAAAASEHLATHEGQDHGHAALGHAAMIGDEVPAPGGPNDLDALLYPQAPEPAQPGRVREYTLHAMENDIEVAQGITYPAWTYNGTAPGPIIRATEGDLLRVKFTNGSSHPHTIHFHGIHPANMDGVFEIVGEGESFTYEFPAKPYGLHLYHCHATPLKKHIHKGLYGAFIVDPPTPRKPAQELVMVMNGFDTDGDGGNNFYTVNGKAFYYAKYPIEVSRSQTVRIYLANLTEFDLINSFHLHAILEIDFSNTGLFMFHAHQSEFAELGWMGFFNVVD